AEVGFPIASALAPAAPYDRVRDGNSTICGSCHRAEEGSPEVTITRGFESDVFRPLKSQEVDLSFLREEYQSCDDEKEAARCALLTAIFGHGELVPRAFAAEASTIYGN